MIISSKQPNKKSKLKIFDGSKQFGSIESKYIRNTAPRETNELNDLDQIRPSLINYIPGKTAQFVRPRQEVYSKLNVNNTSVDEAPRTKSRKKSKNQANQMTFNYERNRSAISIIKRDETKLKLDQNLKNQDPDLKMSQNFSKLVDKNYILMDKISRLKHATSTQSNQMSSYLDNVMHEDEKPTKPKRQNSSKQKLSKNLPIEAVFSLSENRIKKSNIPKLPENILNLTQELSKLSPSEKTLMSNSNSKTKINSLKTKSNSLQDKSNNSKISNQEELEKMIINLEDKQELPDKIKTAKEEFFDDHSKISKNILINEKTKFPQSNENIPNVECSPSLSQKDLKQFNKTHNFASEKSKSPDSKSNTIKKNKDEGSTKKNNKQDDQFYEFDKFKNTHKNDTGIDQVKNTSGNESRVLLESNSNKEIKKDYSNNSLNFREDTYEPTKKLTIDIDENDKNNQETNEILRVSNSLSLIKNDFNTPVENSVGQSYNVNLNPLIETNHSDSLNLDCNIDFGDSKGKQTINDANNDSTINEIKIDQTKSISNDLESDKNQGGELKVRNEDQKSDDKKINIEINENNNVCEVKEDDNEFDNNLEFNTTMAINDQK